MGWLTSPSPHNPVGRRARGLALALSAALVATPLSALAADATPHDPSSDAVAAATGTDAREAKSGVGTLKLGAGLKDFDSATALLTLLNQQRGGYDVRADAQLQEVALQRAAETSIWFSHERPAGGDFTSLMPAPTPDESTPDEPAADTPEEGTPEEGTPEEASAAEVGEGVLISSEPSTRAEGETDDTQAPADGDASGDEGEGGAEEDPQPPAAVPDPKEFIYYGRDATPADALSALLQQSAADLTDEGYRSVGIGCWSQGSEHFFVVILSGEEMGAPARPTIGTASWNPEVEVDLSGATSRVLQGRLQAENYRTNLAMIPNSSRGVRFSWVTAPAESELATASNLPSIAIEPTSFTWTSSDQAIATVSPTGVVTMRQESVYTPHTSREAGADITATLEGTDKSLTFHVNGAVPVYRLFNPENNAHLYTTDTNEYQTLPDYGWVPEGLKWQSVWSSTEQGKITGTPVYRLLNPSNGDHHYTTDSNEYDTLPVYGWEQEDIAFFSADGLEGEPIYRLYNSYLTANEGLGSHLWTSDANEYHTLGAQGWNQEGIGLYGIGETS